jgi:hypothetical protein
MNATWLSSRRRKHWPIRSRKKKRPKMPKKTPSSNNCLKKTSAAAEKRKNSLSCVKSFTKHNLNNESVRSKFERKKKDKILNNNFNTPSMKPRSSSENKKKKNSPWKRFFLIQAFR